ncbi:MAG: flippase-like domain-containing protein [Oligoflexia bacterium]|nr:flippase-like domain-containing protein [Oligoflexia bacterium]
MAISLVVTVAIFWILFRFVSPQQVYDLLKGADRSAVLMFVALSFLMSFCRAWRYQMLLKLSGYSPHLFVVYLVVLVGNFFSDLLPARLGSLIYVFIITTRLGVPFGAAMSSFAVAFLFDMLSLAPLLILIAIGVGGGESISIGLIAGAGLVVAVVASLLLKYLPHLFDWLSNFVTRVRFLSEQKRQKFAHSFHASAAEIQKTLEAGVLTRVFLLSLVIRTIKYGAQYMFLFALLRPMGYEIATLSIPKVFLGISASETAAGVPFAGVGGFGIYEGTWALVFQLLGLSSDLATITGIAVHLCIQFWGYLLGAIALGILLLPALRTEEAPSFSGQARDHALWFYGKLAACLILLGLSFSFFER